MFCTVILTIGCTRGKWREPSWVCVLFRHSEIQLLWLDRPELALQDDTIFVGYDVIWPAILDFTIFLKSQEKSEINTKSRENAHEMYIAMNYCNLVKKTGEKLQNYLEKVDFWPDLHEIWWLPWQRQKWCTHNWHIKISAENEGTAAESFSPLG